MSTAPHKSPSKRQKLPAGSAFFPLCVAAFLGLVAAFVTVGAPALSANFLDEEYREIFRQNTNATGVLHNTQTANSFEGEIRRVVIDVAFPIFRYIFLGVATLYFALYIVTFIVAAGEEEMITKGKTSLLYSLLGFGLISLAEEVGAVLTPIAGDNAKYLVDAATAQEIILNVVAFLQGALGIAALIATLWGGLTFLRSDGDEGTAEEGQKILAWGALGLLVSILSVPLVETVFYPDSKTLGTTQIGNFSGELFSLMKFLFTFFGSLCVLSFVVCGAFYLTSFGDEERQKRAKTMAIGTCLGAVLMFSSYALTRVLVPAAA